MGGEVVVKVDGRRDEVVGWDDTKQEERQGGGEGEGGGKERKMEVGNSHHRRTR